ncbi:MAG TPA: hypothetical protein PK323_03375 [Bacteroidia bacterium]|nr:hypothetical protein [Bacteroidia bacterium]
MATYRPAVKDDDGYIQKIIKYIPAEIVTGYTALVGYLAVGANTEVPPHYKTYYVILLSLLTVITPVWTYFAVLDVDATDPVNQRKRAYFHAFIATIAFLIWIYTVGNFILKAVLCNCSHTGCPDCIYYSPVLGSIILVLFTIITPLIERIILGTKLSTNNERQRDMQA